MDIFDDHLPRALHLAQHIIKSRVLPGDLVVDATIGNGHDTLFLANLVGSEGKVIGFDIQASAIQTTREKTIDFPQVELFHLGHEKVGSCLDGLPSAAMFNLGYLPGTDKQIVTNPQTTLAALDQLATPLLPKGVITIVLYTGHDGGAEEAAAVKAWGQGLDQSLYTVIEYGFVNQKNTPPSLIVIERK
ncbi:MAG: class I SAM-dependent methyltransferase [Fimbriimonadaceae bacterium]